MAIYLATAPDGSVFSRESKRPLTFGIAHQSGESWVVNSFSFGTELTAQKRMRSLQKFYGGQWQVIEARPQKDD